MNKEDYMYLSEAIKGRKSIRAYLDRPVEKETLREVLTLASRAVSATNAQPWEFYVAAGNPLEQLKEENIKAARAGESPDYTFPDPGGVYHARRVEIAKKLFAAMGIAREDKEKRNRWTERTYRYFDAPAVIFICMDKEISQDFRLDIGCVTQNICLAAMEYGLGTCVTYGGILYQKKMREILEIPEQKEPVCAVAIGYPDMSFPANHVISSREDVDRITRWKGFD